MAKSGEDTHTRMLLRERKRARAYLHEGLHTPTPFLAKHPLSVREYPPSLTPYRMFPVLLIEKYTHKRV